MYDNPGAFNDVTSGNIGGEHVHCDTATYTYLYLCAAGPGYDGPTGLGTPNGIEALKSHRPGQPISVTATPGAAAATVSWVAPVSNGGYPISSYTVTSNPGGQTCTTAALSCTVNGLTNGQAYTFTVTASNSVGAGAASDPSSPVTPATVPGAPTSVVGVGGNGAANISWLAPAYDGGAAISVYIVTSVPGNITCSNGSTTNCQISGLTNGTAYQFSVAAQNAVGVGPSSTLSAPITPTAVPLPPTAVTGTAGAGSVQVAWTAPTSFGSGTFSNYTAIAYPGGQFCYATTTLSCLVSGLTNGTPYTFKVTASSSIGTSLASVASAPVVPRTVPNAPTNVVAVAANANASVSWTAPSFNGGATITGYTVTSSPGGKTCTSASLSCTVSGLTNRTSYQFTVTATNVAGNSVPSTTSNAVTPLNGATFMPVTPNRILSRLFYSQTPGSFQVTGQGGVPTGPEVIAVTGNLTVTGQTNDGFVFIGPTSTPAPTSSTINCTIGGSCANNVTVVLGTGGILWVTYYAGTPGAPRAATVLFDVSGYYVANASGTTFVPLSPQRILNRVFNSQVPGSFQVTGQGGVPAGAFAVTGNLTVVGQTAAGFVYLGPNQVITPTTSTVNCTVGGTCANGVTVPLTTGGALWVTYYAASTGKQATVLFDVLGYFVANASGATFVPLTPNRILNSVVSSSVPKSLQVTGQGGVPTGAGVIAVTGNLTAVAPTAVGFVYAGPLNAVPPQTSTINCPVAGTCANGITSALTTSGVLWIIYYTGGTGKQVTMLFDVSGYFTTG